MTTEIRMHRGAPALFIDGRVSSGMTYMTYDKSLAHVGDFGVAGVPLASFCATPDHSYYGFVPTTWIGPDAFDYSDFDARMATILTQHPDVYLIPRLYCCAPPWWMEQHPEERSLGQRVGSHEEQYGAQPSFASELWRRAGNEALRRFIERAEKQPYADRIIGYHLAGGSTEEWYYLDYWDDVARDFSEPQRRAFGAWLEQLYGTPAALRQAWDDECVSFAEVSIPTRAERLSPSLGEVRDRRGPDRRVADYLAFHSAIVSDVIAELARTAKAACGRRKIVGAFQGYIFELCGGGQGPAEGGHLAMGALLRCPDLDFFTAPTSYCFRPLAEGTASFMAPIASIRHHGKLWFDENDLRTHRSPRPGYWRTADAAETIAMQERETALVVTEGTGMWWFDMSGGWYDDPAVMTAITRLNGVAEKALHCSRESAAEIAVVVDEASMCYLRPGCHFASRLMSMQRLELARLGAPVDMVYLDDLAELRPYRMYIFLNLLCLDPARKAMLETVVKRRDQLAIWVYLPGLLTERFDAGNVSALIDIDVTVRLSYGMMEVETVAESSLVRAGCPAGVRFGVPVSMQPSATCEDAGAEALGVSDTGGVLLAMKKLPGWTSIWSLAPCLPACVLRAAARLAGVHLYAESDDPQYVNRSFYAIHARTGGGKPISLPREVAVTDALTGRPIAVQPVSEVALTMQPGETRLLFLGSQQAWRELS